MKTAQRTPSGRSRLIVLNECAGDAEVAQALVMKSFAQPSATVGVALGYDDERQERDWIGHSAHEVKPAEDVVSLKTWHRWPPPRNTAAMRALAIRTIHGDHSAVFFRLFHRGNFLV
jgi:hypothetical protein